MTTLQRLSLLLVATIICLSVCVSGEEGLAVYYSFERGEGAVVCDDSGNGCDGKTEGVVERVECPFGRCLRFNGQQGSRVLVPGNPVLDIRDEITVSFWFRCDELPVRDEHWKELKADCATLFSKNWNWRCRIYPGGFVRVFMSKELPVTPARAGDKTIILTSSYPVETGRWYHLTYVYSVSESRFTLYLNGKKQAEETKNITGFKVEENHPILLGESPGNWNPYNGYIDEVCIYNRALSGEEINKKTFKMSVSQAESWESSLEEIKGMAHPIASSGMQGLIEGVDLDSRLTALKRRIQGIRERNLVVPLREYTEIDSSVCYLATVFREIKEAAAALRAGEIKVKHLLCYTVAPVSSIVRRSDTFADDRKISDSLFVIAAPGEYQPSSFILLSPFMDISSLELKPTPLTGKTGSIPATTVDIKAVKCWYQAGTAWHYIGSNEHGQNITGRILVPELLLNDASLVKVDYEDKHNYVRLDYPEGANYVCISRVPEVYEDASGPNIPAVEFPVKDSPVLLPVDIKEGSQQQFWVTVKVPEETPPGIYTGKINLSAKDKSLGAINLNLRVLPFKLAAPKTKYNLEEDFTSSIYYKGMLAPTGEGGPTMQYFYWRQWYKTEEQLRAELKNMYAHGITNPQIYQLQRFNDMDLLRRHLEIREEIGMGGRPLYHLGKGSNLDFGTPGETDRLELLKKRTEDLLDVAGEFNITDVYFYGIDEARGERLIAQRPAWKAIQEAGGKVFVSGYHGHFEKVGDLLNLIVMYGPPLKEEAAKWHLAGHKIWCYANPQGGVENPEVYRRNFGLLLWQSDYDGASTYIYQHGFGHIWNDFDHPTRRNLNFTYPTVNGVIDTIAWEGYREGVDDIRYATTLKLKISQARQSKDKKMRDLALSAEKYLEELDVNRDLDTVRLEIIDYILKLQAEK